MPQVFGLHISFEMARCSDLQRGYLGIPLNFISLSFVDLGWQGEGNQVNGVSIVSRHLKYIIPFNPPDNSWR